MTFLPNIIFGLLHMDYDDGFIVYFNGNEVIRENLGEPGTEVLYNQYADTNVEANIYRGLKPEQFLIENLILSKKDQKKEDFFDNFKDE